MHNFIAGEPPEVTQTTRDLFAMAALPALIEALFNQTGSRQIDEISKLLARSSYKFADAMMAERAK